MPTRTTRIRKVLIDEIEAIKAEIAEVNKHRDKLIRDLEEAEKSLDAIIPNRVKDAYNKDSSFRQKIFYCLKTRNRQLSINDMMTTLFEVDKDLKEDEKNTNNSLRQTIFRMVRSGEVLEYKTEDHKMIHYGLPEWE